MSVSTQQSKASTTAAAGSNGQPKLQRGWTGFGRNYFHSLGTEAWPEVPQEESRGEGGPYSWGILETTTTSNENNSTAGTSDHNPLLVAYRYTSEIPSKVKRKKDTQNKINKKQQPQQPLPDEAGFQIAPAACSSAASYFLSGSRHNRITTLGTIHGRIMNPVLEAIQNKQQPSQQQWNCSMMSPSTLTIPLPLPCVELAAGRHFCLARLEGGQAVLSWGAGHFGQLGHGASFATEAGGQNSSTFQATPKVMDRLLPRMVGCPIAQIAAGDWHGMALTQEGTVLAWGCNRNMQCGRKTPRSSMSKAGGDAAAAAAASTSAPLQMTPQPVVILDTDPDKADDPPVAIAKITCGKAHSVAITKRNQVYCWGASHYGQCASNTGSSIRTSKYTRNTTSLPRLVISLQDVTVVDVAAGDRHTLALTQGGRVFSWGAGAEGQLGIFPPICATPRPRLIHDLDFVAICAANMQPQQSDSAQSLASVPTITSVHAAGCSSSALSSLGHVYVWGSNDAGNLGLTIPHSSQLPYWEVQSTPLPPNDERLLEVKTFDSQHNVLLPRRVDALATMHVEQIMMGPSHTWNLGESRDASDLSTGHDDNDGGARIGRTLFEVQASRKAKAQNGGGGQPSSSQVGRLTPAGSSITSASWDGGTTTTNASRRVLSPSSTMPTDDEDDVTTDTSMSVSMPALTDAVGRRGLPDPAGSDNSQQQKGGKRQGRRHSDFLLSSSKNRQFSLPNLLRRLGGSNRRNKDKDRDASASSNNNNNNNDVSIPESEGAATATIGGSGDLGSSAASNGDKSEGSGKGRFRLR